MVPGVRDCERCMVSGRDQSPLHNGREEAARLAVPKALESALSLLRDTSESVRAAALQKVCDSRDTLTSIPREVMRFVFRERDGALVSLGLEIVGALLSKDHSAAPLLIHFLNDSRPEVSIRTRTILAASFESHPEVVIPLYVKCAGAAGTAETRELARSLLSHAKERGVTAEPSVIRGILARYVGSHKSGKGGVVDDSVAWAIAWGLSDPTLSLRQFSINMLAKAARGLTPFQTRIIEGACAFIAHKVMEKKTHHPSLFLDSLRDMRVSSGFCHILQSIDCGRNAVLEMQREFTSVYLSGHEPPKAALKGLLEFLRESDPSLVMAAASNLGVLIHDLPRSLGEKLLNQIWGVVRLRQFEDPLIYRALLHAFDGQIGHQDWIVGLCSKELMTHPDRITQEVVARILSHNPPLSDHSLERVRGMLRYLAGSEHPLVAELAASALGE
jgi:hypothetical protein